MTESSTPMTVSHFKEDLVAIAMGAAVFVVLYVTAQQIGYARDEGFYFQAAASYGQWLMILFDDPNHAISRKVVDAHFAINAEHPSFMKLLFALSEQFLHERWEIVQTPGLAYRVPAMVMSGLATTVTVAFTSRLLSLNAGILAGLLLSFMPRWFHHSHLACFDVPVATTVLLCTLVYLRAIKSKSLFLAIVLGIVFGIALDTKHNAWWLPVVFAVHLITTHGRSFLVMSRTERWQTLRPLVVMVFIGPLVLWVLWPWLWYDTLNRLKYWVDFHLNHVYYNMEFLGRTYHTPPMPRGYAWLMTLATVPGTTLVLAATGLGTCVVHAVQSTRHLRRYATIAPSPPAATSRDSMQPQTTSKEPRRYVTLLPAPWDERRSTDWLLFLSLLSAYAPWWFTTTPIFGGTKHWLSAYPFLCVFAARGYGLWGAKIRLFIKKGRAQEAVLYLGTLSLFAPSVVMSLEALPWGLSAYTPIVGGAPGAASLGLNRTFWGYTTLSMVEAMQELAPSGAKVFVHDTAISSFQMHQLDGTFQRNWTPTLDIAASRLALYHHEPHMARVEFQIWEAYRTTIPASVAVFDGVPIVWLYVRP
jgi:4-amino-4-deoxy-L-arabinose transferase-like glycosyltransferase